MKSTYHDIPETITLDFVKGWVRPRVSDKRFKHIQGVVDVARLLANKAGEDIFLAELGAWLHDACKEFKEKELVRIAREHGLRLHPVEVKHGHLLHGPVAAIVAREELGITNQLLLNAVSEHTLGAAPMSLMSQILFLADCLDAGRPPEYQEPIWKALDINGKFSLEKAILVACDLNLKHLLDSGKPIHPKTVEVRDYYLELVRRNA